VPRVLTPARRPALTVAAVALAAVAPAAGCSGPAAPSRATVASCYAFAVQALDRHVRVTSVPPACAGLTHEQINQAVDRAVRTAVGPHRKVVARRLDHREAAYLSYLVTVVPPRAPAPSPAAPARPSSRVPLELATLAAWVVTVAAGTWMLAGWLARGGLRRRYARVAGVPRPVIVGHFTLALTGLGLWIWFLATGVPALAWAAVVVVLAVAGLGMATLAGGLPERAAEPGGGPAAEPAGEPMKRPAPGADPVRPGRPPELTAEPVTRALARPEAPVARIVIHGVLAAVTILLVVLAAIGARPPS
jgi:manganese efflux pump family protein